MSRRRELPPWSRHHEPWCAIFRGKACDCDDDDDRRPRRRRPLSGGDAPVPECKKEELEDESWPLEGQLVCEARLSPKYRMLDTRRAARNASERRALREQQQGATLSQFAQSEVDTPRGRFGAWVGRELQRRVQERPHHALWVWASE